MPKPSRQVSSGGEDVNWRELVAKGEIDLDEARQLVPSTCIVSGGEWTGTRLSEVLTRAGVKDSAVAIRVEGFDQGRPDSSLVHRSAGRSDFEIFDPRRHQLRQGSAHREGHGLGHHIGLGP